MSYDISKEESPSFPQYVGGVMTLAHSTSGSHANLFLQKVPTLSTYPPFH